MKEMVRHLRDQYVSPMPVDDLLKLLPVTHEQLRSRPAFEHDYFTVLQDCAVEKDMYDPFISSVTASKAMRGFKLVNWCRYQDRQSKNNMKLYPFVAAYKQSAMNPQNIAQYEEIELIFEFRASRAQADPFDCRTTTMNKDRYPFESKAQKRTDCRIQIDSHANTLLSRQHHTHCYVVYIEDLTTRIIRFDRSGGLVSALLDYRTQSHLLLEFLWRFSETTDEARGIDTSVRVMPLNNPIVEIVKDKLQEWKPWSSSKENTILELDIPETVADEDRIDPDSETHGNDLEPAPKRSVNIRKVYIWGSLAEPGSVSGRATRGYPGWDPTLREGKGVVVFVKDSWRSCEPGIEKETDILRTLNKHNVQNVPVCLCGDDIPSQVTVTQDYATADWNVGAGAGRCVRRAHIRFAEDLVGIELDKFKSSRQLAKVVYDAFIAHKESYEKCGILHRDISGGNILLRADLSGGFLNDWDLAVTYNKATHSPVKSKCQPPRSGTWQFMSIPLLENPDKVHRLQDDVESFLWVLLYYTLRYMEHSVPSSDAIVLGSVMTRLFDYADPALPGRMQMGGVWKRALIRDGLPKELGKLSVFDNEPMTSMINTVIKMWRSWYKYLQDIKEVTHELPSENKGANGNRDTVLTQVPNDTSHLEKYDHEAITTFWKQQLDILDKWPEKDASFDYLRITQKPRQEQESDDEGGDDILGPVPPDNEPQQKKERSNRHPSRLRCTT